jgi:signal transduction histidine kinase
MAQKAGLHSIDLIDRPSQLDVSGADLHTYLPLFEGTHQMAIIPFDTIAPQEEDLFSIAIRRTGGIGIVSVSINAAQMRRLRRRFAIQDVLERTGPGEGIQYLLVFDNAARPVAEVIDEGIEDAIDLASVQLLQGRTRLESRFRSVAPKQEIFEIAKVLDLGETPFGVIQAGLSTDQIQRIVSISRRNTILSVVVLLALSMTGVILIYVNQRRHLQKLREMEQKAYAAERLLSIGKLGAGLAHEIRNPLNAVAMAIQRLHREFLPSEEQRAEEYGRFIRVIREEIKRLNQVVDQFVLFSKPYKLSLAPVQIGDILDSLSILFAAEAESRSVELEKTVDEGLPPIVMDKDKITQALINIVTNGLHAIEDGGKLTLSAGMDRRDRLRITIADTGKGIPKERIQRVFDYAFTTREKGLGLGLPIAHKILEEHRGEIVIDSKVGEGTRVSVFLPAEGP